jgi:Cu+-exporting ATPase
MSVKDRIATDPVCGMKVDRQNSRGTFDYEGRTYYFCSPGCERSCRESPGKGINDPSYPRGGASLSGLCSPAPFVATLPPDRLRSRTANVAATDFSPGRRKAGPHS